MFNRRLIVVLVASLFALSACNRERNPNPAETETDPETTKLADAVTFTNLSIFQGFIDPDVDTARAVDPQQLESGDLVTIQAEFNITGDVSSYGFQFHLLQMSLVSQLSSGSTLGAIMGKNVPSNPEEQQLDLGGIVAKGLTPGSNTVSYHVKLPILSETQEFKVAVTPSLSFLTQGRTISEHDFKKIPALIDDEQLTINLLQTASVELVETPDLTFDYEFTRLERYEDFGANPYAQEPLFQTSVNVDVSTFEESEDVVMTLAWVANGGTEYPLGLYVPDGNSSAIVTEAEVNVEQLSEPNTSVAVVPFLTPQAHNQMVKEATFVQDVADETPDMGEFLLRLGHLESGVFVESGSAYSLLLPLVSQDNSPIVKAIEDSPGYTVLRAGLLNNACLHLPSGSMDIDTGNLGINANVELEASECDETPRSHFLWRYDQQSQQLISKVQDDNGDNYCITAMEEPIFAQKLLQVNAPPIINLASYREVGVQKCDFRESEIGDFAPPGTSIYQQIFTFEGDNLALSFGNRYVAVSDINSVSRDVILAVGEDNATSINRDLNGRQLDNQGRIFYIGDEFELAIGPQSFAHANLSVSGESFIDYLPIIGSTTTGDATLSLELMEFSQDIINAHFEHQRYLPKKTPGFGVNLAEIEVGNGSEFFVDFFGARLREHSNLETSTVTESFDPLENYVNALTDPIPDLELPLRIDDAEIDKEIFSTSFMVFVVPVTLSGGVSGSLGFEFDFETEDISANLDVSQDLDFAAFLRAEADGLIASAGINGEVEFIKETFQFDANAGFVASGTTLGVTMGTSLDADLKLLKGKLTAFAEYPKLCFCTSVGETVHSEKTLYESDYLFSQSWDVYKQNPIFINLVQ